MLDFIKEVLNNMPDDWLRLTTHRLDIYEEKLAKTQFLEHFEILYKNNNAELSALNDLPTAYDYIRLGHPLSCVLEWVIAHLNKLKSENVISFASKMTPILAVLRKNLLDNKKTQIVYSDELPDCFDTEILQHVYNYKFELNKVGSVADITPFDGSTIFLSQNNEIGVTNLTPNIDFFINIHEPLGSVILVNGDNNEDYISEIQHVRRRETVAMTPADCFAALKYLTEQTAIERENEDAEVNKSFVLDKIKEITGTNVTPLLASSGLSIQYAIMMGLVHHALEQYQGKDIKWVVPPNCYGGTNDQARRVAACIDKVEIVDLPVDDGDDMVQSLDRVLEKIAQKDAVPFIIAEIPTNPRVEVPDLIALKKVLSQPRTTAAGKTAVDPVFILDQTFCPNVHFLGQGEVLSTMKAISYSSGSKFPSGGLCNAGYCVANDKAKTLMDKIALHLKVCDNEATNLQVEILAQQLPSMNQRIQDAYENTREFVNFIQETLPEAKINFVSEALAKEGFTPSVFSLDLPTKGNSEAEKEAYKRKLNRQLINMMITEIPNESKHCVSYGQLKGCYWTIPATSTQGTTKEGDKDYIARVALSPDMDLDLHKKVFSTFVENI